LSESGARASGAFENPFRSALWALRTTWETNASAALSLVGVTILRGITPAGIALTAKGLIDLIVHPIHRGEFAPLVPWLVAGLVLAIVDALGPMLNKLVVKRLTDDLTHRVTCDVLEHSARLDVGSLEDPKLRDVIERARQSTTGAFSNFVVHLTATVTSVVQIVSMVALLVHMQPAVLLVAGPFAVPYIVFRWRTATARHSEDVRRSTKKRWTGYFVSHVTGQRSAIETRLLGLTPLFISRYKALMDEFRARDRRMGVRDFLGSSAFAVLTTVAFYAIFARVVWLVVQNALTIGDVAVFLAVSSRLRLTLERGIAEGSDTLEHALHIGRLREFLALEPRIADGAGPAPETPRGALEFVGVRFAYPGGSRPILSDVSFRVAPGEVVAIVGENGAGKTTLVKLIARIYDPAEGRVLLDGVDLREWPLDALHTSVGFLAQGSARYEATAGDNIAYGDWRTLLGDAEAVRDAARAARVDDLVEGMPRGYDTVLGPMFGEHDLSGGQWQKLAVARTLARNACLLVLDEPSAHLDARTEYELFRRFRDLARGRTTILVSHRLTMLGLADRILMIDRGRVVESGTHDELIALSGHYARLFEMHQVRMGLGGTARLDRAGEGSHVD
jgi:ATP-binding cassette, subfamily B, bacterial